MDSVIYMTVFAVLCREDQHSDHCVKFTVAKQEETLHLQTKLTSNQWLLAEAFVHQTMFLMKTNRSRFQFDSEDELLVLQLNESSNNATWQAVFAICKN